MCRKRYTMATNLALDDKLIIQAQKAGNHKTKKDAVTAALKEYIAHKKQLEVTRVFGTIAFDKRFNYKKARKR
jgi:Arc/MetJ family transcription regulator